MKLLIATLLLLAAPSIAAADDFEYTAFPKGTFTLHAYAAYVDDLESTDYAIPSINVGAGWYVWDTYQDNIRSIMGWEEPKDYEAGQAHGEALVTIVSGDNGSSISRTLASKTAGSRGPWTRAPPGML